MLMGIGEVKTAVELVGVLEKTGMSTGMIIGCVAVLIIIVVYGSVLFKMCRVMIEIGRLMIKWDKAQEVDRVTYRAEFSSLNKVTDDHAAKLGDHSEKLGDHEHRLAECQNRISVLDKNK